MESNNVGRKGRGVFRQGKLILSHHLGWIRGSCREVSMDCISSQYSIQKTEVPLSLCNRDLVEKMHRLYRWWKNWGSQDTASAPRLKGQKEKVMLEPRCEGHWQKQGSHWNCGVMLETYRCYYGREGWGEIIKLLPPSSSPKLFLQHLHCLNPT